MREVAYWISDGEFSGVISLRRLQNADELPAGVSGHVSYAVVPWKSRKGCARQALADLLQRALPLRLPVAFSAGARQTYRRRPVSVGEILLACFSR
jgi:predicted acetyltransferase